MSIKIVTPSEAAADPKHPEHARWVKERTLAMEANHASAVGLTFRQAEDANLANLIRLEARKQKPKAPRKPKRKGREITPTTEEHARLKAAGVIKRKARITPALKSMCNWCGLCIRCKREGRLQLIMAKARLGDDKARALVMELVAMGFAAQSRKDYKDAIGRELPFSRLRGHDRNLAVTAGAEWVCDRSVPFMGEWR